MKRGLISKLARRLAILIGALVAVLAVFILEENLRGRILLARYKAELRAKGEKLTSEELHLPAVPKEGNGAKALLAAANELVAVSKTGPLCPSGPFTAPGRRVVCCLQPDLGVEKVEATPGRWKFFRAITEESSVAEEPPAVKRPMIGWEDLVQQIASAREPLRRARMASEQPVLAVAIDYSHGFLESYGLQTHAARTVARWLASDALLALREGHLDDARVDVAAIAAIARIFRLDRSTHLQVIDARIGETGLGVTWEALHIDGRDDVSLAKWQQLWQGEDGLAATVASAEVERTLALLLWKKTIRWPTLKDFRAGLWDYKGMPWWEGLREIARELLWRLALQPQDELRLLRQWQGVLDIFRAARDSHSWVAASASFESDLTAERQQWCGYDNWRYLLSGALRPVMPESTLRIQMQFETQRQMTVTAIALERYKLAHERFPEQLDKLIPQYLSELPQDYMDGKPLRYRRTGDGSFLLYSVGEDGVNNGGDPNPPQRKTFYQMWDGRDAVWPQPAPLDDAARVP